MPESASMGIILSCFLATLIMFFAADRLWRRAKFLPLLHPVLIASIGLIALLLALGVSYETYRLANLPLLFLLGPATVALAVPLFRLLPRLRRAWLPLLLSIGFGSVVAIVSAVLIGWLLGLSPDTLRTLVGKSVTTPIAMGVAEQVGGAPELAAAIVIVVGIIGAAVAEPLLRLLRVDNPMAKGVSIGLAAHGVGTARAMQISPEMGAYAGLAMGLTGLVTAAIAALISLFV